jgi:hypothetical protein
MWTRGDVVVSRQLFRGRIWNAAATIVVSDDAEATVRWLPVGADIRAPSGSLFGEWTLRTERAGGPPVLVVTPGSRPHSILLFWNEDGSLRNWYVNLEGAHRRTALGFDHEDHLVDIWIDPDGSWRWLDEDELGEAVRCDVFSESQARAIRAEGERVLAECPFPTGWEDWRPDPTWPIPQLPKSWSVL